MTLILKRLGASIIDIYIAFVLVWLIDKLGNLIGVFNTTVDGSVGNFLNQSILIICIIFVYLTSNKYLNNSPGRKLFKIAVYNEDNKQLDDPLTILSRELFKYLPISLILIQPALGFLIIGYWISFYFMIRNKHKSLHDKIFKTHVDRLENLKVL